MKLTLQTDLAIRVMVYVAINQKGRSTIHDLAQRYSVSENHLMKVVNKLTKLGFLDSTRGRTGGLKINTETMAIPLGDLVRAVEYDLEMIPCLKDPDCCIIRRACLFRSAVQEAQDAFFETLNKYTFADLVEPHQKLTKILRIIPDPSQRGLEAV